MKVRMVVVVVLHIYYIFFSVLQQHPLSPWTWTFLIVVIRDSKVKAVEVMLSHIYTGEIPSYLGQEGNLHLLQLADIYGLDRLKCACADNIVTRLSISTVVWRYRPPVPPGRIGGGRR